MQNIGIVKINYGLPRPVEILTIPCHGFAFAQFYECAMTGKCDMGAGCREETKRRVFVL
jgi:hypothetical protein